MYVDFNGNTNIVISIGTTGAIGRAWNIKVTQINCNCPTKGKQIFKKLFHIFYLKSYLFSANGKFNVLAKFS